MLVINEGKVIIFTCATCDCKFAVGIRAVEKTNDGNFYCVCPACGTRCHADFATQSVEGNDMSWYSKYEEKRRATVEALQKSREESSSAR